MTDFRHVPPREILRQVADTIRKVPAGPIIAGVPREEVGRAIRQLLCSLDDSADEVWTPFQPARAADRSTDDDYVAALVKSTGFTEDFVREQLRRSAREYRYYVNNLYQIGIREIETGPGSPGMIHLSIKRIDQTTIRDWRHLQRIKNELVGPDFEGVELYPAESRLVDSSTQYHLWVVDDASYRWPFGFGERFVVDDDAADGTGAVQRARTP